MIVRCKFNVVGDSFPSSLREDWAKHNFERHFPLTVGARYGVYAITVRHGIPWYYIDTDDRLRWPTWYPASIFDVVDGSFPASWRYGYYFLDADTQFPIFSFPEWANDRFFYERLVDDELEALEIYQRRRLEVDGAPVSESA